MQSPTTSARCPACGELRDPEVEAGLRRAEERWLAREGTWPPPGRRSLAPMRELARENHPNWFWACDDCLASGRALAADVMNENLSMGTAFAAYVDRPFRCEDCRADTRFSASEQRHWFETLGFLIWVYPKQCQACRAARRAKAKTNRELAEALHGLDPRDATQLDAVARLYDELGATSKATLFRARAKNRRRADD
jgi:hypothetical protein